jgi:hypothetical protein
MTSSEFTKNMDQAVAANAAHDRLTPLEKAIDKIHRELAPLKPESEGYLPDGGYEFIVILDGQKHRGVISAAGELVADEVL